jgi:hypothetical protein
MAYVPKSGIAQSPEEDAAWKVQAKPVAPTLGGGGGSLTGSGGSSPMGGGGVPGMGRQQGSAMQPRGSGFVNLQSFLSPAVAKQQQQQVKNTGQTLDQGARDEFGKAANTAQTAVNNASAATMDEPGLANTLNQAGSGNQSAFEQLQKLVSQSYTGPTGVDFDVENNANIKRLAGLQNGATALDALRPELRGNLQYGQGNRWLDQSMLQSDAGTAQRFDAIKKNTEGLGKWMDTTNKGVADAAAAKGAAIDAARKSTMDSLRGIGGNLVAEAQRKADAANAQQEADRILGTRQGNSYMGPWTGGSSPNATAANFIGAGGANNLAKLAELLGDPSLAMQDAGKWKSGHYNYAGPKPDAAQLKKQREEAEKRKWKQGSRPGGQPGPGQAGKRSGGANAGGFDRTPSGGGGGGVTSQTAADYGIPTNGHGGTSFHYANY